MSPIQTTRLAPSPTGALHLGNARTFLITWVLARRSGWRVLLRIDDLEGPRVKAGADRQAIEDLKWLGLDWEGPVLYQSTRYSAYAQALTQLERAGMTYPCVCSRTEIEAAAGTRIEPDQATRYPGTCRGRFASVAEARQVTGREPASRFAVPDRTISYSDAFAGQHRFHGQRQLGDFVVRKSDGEIGYHLATVVDDAAAGVTHVVRGQDLIASTPRQILVYEALGMATKIPTYMHLPLILGTDGKKLAKRHGDTRLGQLRQEGVSAGAVRALLARWSGWTPAGAEATLDEWTERFSLTGLPREAIVYDDARDRPGSRPLAAARGNA